MIKKLFLPLILAGLFVFNVPAHAVKYDINVGDYYRVMYKAKLIIQSQMPYVGYRLSNFRGDKKTYDKYVYRYYYNTLMRVSENVNNMVAWRYDTPNRLTKRELAFVIQTNAIIVKHFYPFANRWEQVLLSHWGRTNPNAAAVKQAKKYVKEVYKHF